MEEEKKCRHSSPHLLESSGISRPTDPGTIPPTCPDAQSCLLSGWPQTCRVRPSSYPEVLPWQPLLSDFTGTAYSGPTENQARKCQTRLIRLRPQTMETSLFVLRDSNCGSSFPQYHSSFQRHTQAESTTRAGHGSRARLKFIVLTPSPSLLQRKQKHARRL